MSIVLLNALFSYLGAVHHWVGFSLIELKATQCLCHSLIVGWKWAFLWVLLRAIPCCVTQGHPLCAGGRIGHGPSQPSDVPSGLPIVLVIQTRVLCPLLELGCGWLSCTKAVAESKEEGFPRGVWETRL